MSQKPLPVEDQIAAAQLVPPSVERLRFETFLADLSATFVHISADQVDDHIESALRQIVEFLDIDRSGFGEMTPEGLKITHSYQVPGVPPSPRVILEKLFPHYARKVQAGEAFRVPEDLPQEATEERAFCVQTGLRTNLTIPLKVTGSIIGGIGFASFRTALEWPVELIQRLRLVGDIFTNALARKRADEALHQATEQARTLRDQLAHATRVELVNHLTSTISHEVNQPLCAIASNAQTAIDLLNLSDIEETRKALQDIWSDAKRASKVIGRVRSMIRKEEPHRAVMSLHSVIEELSPILRREATAQGVEAIIDLQALESLVDCDRVQLQQVVLNLLLNAVEAVSTSSGGSPRVTIHTCEEGASSVCIRVSDSGCGLSAEDCERVFTPFYTTKSNGLGLGLSISRSIVAAHGGNIWATTGQGAGTTFHVRLPVIPRGQS